MDTRKVGAAGETAALSFYLRNGYGLVTRNWHFSRFGEIDLILSYSEYITGKTNDFLVFCEVKLRTEKSFLTPAESVNLQKQNRVRKLAEIFIELNPQYENHNVRFDVAEIYSSDKKEHRIRILTDAF